MINKVWCVFQLDKSNKYHVLLAVFDDVNKASLFLEEHVEQAKKDGNALRYSYFIDVRFVQ